MTEVRCPVCNRKLKLSISVKKFEAAELGDTLVIRISCPGHWPKRHARLRSMPLRVYTQLKDLPEFPEFLALQVRAACLPGAPLGAWANIYKS
jgi:hypothetical protein